MTPTLDTRKPVVKLTIKDFLCFPVWEYAIDEVGVGVQDETWVRPVVCRFIGKRAYAIVASDFTARAGQKLQGFMIVSTLASEPEIRAGAVLGRIGYFVLPSLSRKLAAARKAHWVLREREALLDGLHLSDDEVFPMRYVIRVLIRGEKQLREGALK